MWRKTLLAICIIAGNTALAQMHNVVIDSLNGPNEPSIAIDPVNPNHMVAGANLANCYISTDGGYHWSNSTLSSSMGVFGDPVLIADTTGAFYYFHLSDNPLIHTWPMWADRIVCQRLDNVITGAWTNGGYTGLVDTPSISDKPGVAINRQTNTLYVTWTKFDKYGTADPSDSSNILFSSSSDRGLTWSTPVRLNETAGDCTDTDPTVEGAVPCVGPNGEIYVGWASYDQLMFDKSLDGGATWLVHDKMITTVPDGWYFDIPGINRCNGLPYTACDISNSAYRGNIYISWSDQRNGVDNTDIWICRSADGGDNWTPPIKVNNDTGVAQQFMNSMTVDPATGYIYVVFYDRRNYLITDTLTDVYLAVSKDGGTTFKNFRISEQPFNPGIGTFFGDYTYISAFNNVVRPIWGTFEKNLPTNRQKILTAIIDSTITGPGVYTANIVPEQNSLNIYPNPFAGSTMVAYNIAEAGEVSVTLTDVSGRIVAQPEKDRIVQAGKNYLQVNAADYHLEPGLYFLTLRSHAYSITQKLVVKR